MKGILSDKKILVVEDDHVLREIICSTIEDKGASVFSAENGLLAYEIIENEEIDFVLSDIQMPVMDGVELLKKIRARDPHRPLVMFITGQCEISSKAAIAAGACCLMQKPFKLNDLLASIEQFLLVAKAS